MKMTKTEISVLNRIKTIKHGAKILVALSGGADSAALLWILSKFRDKVGYELFACHVNHMIRGGEADGDEEFSRKLSQRLGARFFSKKINVPLLAETEHISEETAGRKARYAYFSEIMNNNNIDFLVTAHHRDDRVETILMNIIRGSGARGFKGIECVSGNIIRPMLDLTKKDILDYCKENNIEFCTDSTNECEDYVRNKIRKRVVPLLEEINPSAASNLIRMSDIISADDDFLNAEAERVLSEAITPKGINIVFLAKHHESIVRRVVFKYFALRKGTPNDISFGDISSICGLFGAESGKSISLGGGYVAAVSYGYLKISKKHDSTYFEYTLNIGQKCIINEIGKCFLLRERTGASHDTFNFTGAEEFKIRCRKDGDFIYPAGMKGRKKLKDLFIDKKVDRHLRDIIPILTVDGQIASVIGLRNDGRFWSKDGNYELICTDIREGIV